MAVDFSAFFVALKRDENELGKDSFERPICQTLLDVVSAISDTNRMPSATSLPLPMLSGK